MNEKDEKFFEELVLNVAIWEHYRNPPSTPTAEYFNQETIIKRFRNDVYFNARVQSLAVNIFGLVKKYNTMTETDLKYDKVRMRAISGDLPFPVV